MPDDPRPVAWARLHHGLDPAAVPFVPVWLQGVWWVARPLRRVPPTLITLLGVVLAGVAVAVASPLPVVALLCVVASVSCDALDGAVALLGSSASRAGATADAVADRLCDVAFALVIWRCGAPWWLAVVAAGLAVGVDLLRRIRRVPTVITPAERPTFAICAALACLCAAVSSVSWPQLVCAAVWIAACVLALVQLTRTQAQSVPISANGV